MRNQLHAPRQEGSPRDPWRVGVSGSYGGVNLGDEAILEGIVQSLRAAAPGPVEITVFSTDPDDTLQRHDVEHAHDRPRSSLKESRAALEGLDLFILGGGGLLYDQAVEGYLRELGLAQELGIPTMTYGISAGPLEKAPSRDLVRRTLEGCAAVTVRDRRAHRLLEEVGIDREILVTADPALLLDAEPLDEEVLRREGLDPDRRLIGFSVREPGPAAPHIDPERYHALLADAGDYVVDRLDADVVFVPLERKNQDLQHSHAVAARMTRADRATVLKGDYSPRQLVGLMRRLDLAVGMRLHFLIFATLAGVPFVALPYAPKVTGYLDELGLDPPPSTDGGAGQLIAYIDRAWDFRESARAAVAARLPELRARAEENARIAVSLVERRRGAPSPSA